MKTEISSSSPFLRIISVEYLFALSCMLNVVTTIEEFFRVNFEPYFFIPLN